MQKKPSPNTKHNDSLGSRVVLSMINHLDNQNDHEIYVENFFLSYNVFVQLKSLGIRITGTVCANRTLGCALKDDKSLKKESHGLIDFEFEEKEELYF